MNVINFLEKLVDYKNDYKSVAEIAIAKFINFLWHLGFESVAPATLDKRMILRGRKDAT